jgi:hypothetical protein
VAPVIGLVAGTGTAPAATGGSITAGTYTLTSATDFGGSGGTRTYQVTAAIGATSIQTIDGPTPQLTNTVNYTTSGTAFNITNETCGSGSYWSDIPAGRTTYTATSTTLTVYRGYPSGETVVYVFTLQ